jgi:hypothetical protein
MESLYQDGLTPSTFIRQVGQVLVVECNNKHDKAVDQTYKCYCLANGIWNMSVQYKTLKAGEKADNWTGRRWRSGFKNYESGQVIGHLTLKERINMPTPSNAHTKGWVTLCSCGKMIERRDGSISESSHCGCRSVNANRVHKQLQRCHINMFQRCYNTRHKSYNYYGGRGITITDEWQDYFVFEKWAMGNGFQPGLSIDRIDNNDGYRPGNCRWTTMEEQARNRRSNIVVECNGGKFCRREFALAYQTSKLGHRTIESRLKSGFNPELAIVANIKQFEAFGKRQSLTEWVLDHRCVVDYKTLQRRVHRGVSVETALQKPPRRGSKTV